MLFDTHAHLDDRAFDTDREDLLAGLADRQVALVMNPGCSLESSRNAVAMANKYPWLYAAVGSHPDAADEVCEEVIAEFEKLCKLSPKVKAIGEIGLDYHYEDIPRQLQQKAFLMQLELARKLDLPVIVLVLGLLCAFRACVLLLVIGLFAGCRYNVGDKEVAGPAAEPVVEV